jgi:hypothetical protein
MQMAVLCCVANFFGKELVQHKSSIFYAAQHVFCPMLPAKNPNVLLPKWSVQEKKVDF